jgi:hypothetical protein
MTCTNATAATAVLVRKVFLFPMMFSLSYAHLAGGHGRTLLASDAETHHIRARTARNLVRLMLMSIKMLADRLQMWHGG